MNPRAILLDWDGTVIDGFHLIHQAMNETLTHYGKEPWDDQTANIQLPRADTDKFPEIFGENWKEPLAYFYAAMTRIGESIEKPDLIPGAQRFMAFLQEARRTGTYVGIVSNSRTAAIQREMRQCGWEGYVDVVVASDSGAPKKPDPGAYAKALENCPLKNLQPFEALYIGDADTDLKFARNTGMQFLGIGNKFTLPRPEAEKATDLNGVVDYLQRVKEQASPQAASSKYGTIRELLTASLNSTPHGEKKRRAHIVYDFADPAFAKYTIHATPYSRRHLKSTSSLTMAEFIFNGPELASALLEGKNKKGETSIATTISIMHKQHRASFNSIVEDKGERALAERLAQHPEKLDHLFRTIAFAGVHEKTFKIHPATTHTGMLFLHGPRLDINPSNVFLDDDGTIELIDQMPYEHIKDQGHKGFQEYEKARESIDYMRDYIINIVKAAREQGADMDLLKPLYSAAYQYSLTTGRILDDAEAMKSKRQSWEHLKEQLSDPHTEQWRGLEDGPTHSPVFRKVHQISVDSLDVDKAKPQQLLDMLNKLHGASVARAR